MILVVPKNLVRQKQGVRGGENMYQETVARYADIAKAAGDLKRAVQMIEAWTGKAEDARKRLNELENGTVAAAPTEVPVTEEPVTQPQ